MFRILVEDIIWHLIDYLKQTSFYRVVAPISPNASSSPLCWLWRETVWPMWGLTWQRLFTRLYHTSPNLLCRWINNLLSVNKTDLKDKTQAVLLYCVYSLLYGRITVDRPGRSTVFVCCLFSTVPRVTFILITRLKTAYCLEASKLKDFFYFGEHPLILLSVCSILVLWAFNFGFV